MEQAQKGKYVIMLKRRTSKPTSRFFLYKMYPENNYCVAHKSWANEQGLEIKTVDSEEEAAKVLVDTNFWSYNFKLAEYKGFQKNQEA